MYKNQWQKALDDFNRAIKLDPEGWNFFHFRGRLYDTLQHFDKAVKSYDKSISLNPRTVISYKNRGKDISLCKECQWFDYAGDKEILKKR